MDRHSIIEGLKLLEQQVIECLDKLDVTQERLVLMAEEGSHDGKHIKAAARELDEELFRLRDLYQRVIFKSALLIKSDGRGD